MINRVLEVQKISGLNDTKFAKSIGYRPQVFSEWKQGVPVTHKAIVTIISQYPQINPRWLVTGEGTMLEGNESVTYSSQDKYSQLNERRTNYNTGSVKTDDGETIVRLNKQITAMNAEISQLKETLKAKNQTIEAQQIAIEALKK